jgi:hypothetical protein
MEFQDDPFSQPKATIQLPFPALSMPVPVFLRKLNNLSGQQLWQCIPDLQITHQAFRSVPFIAAQKRK